MVVGEVRVYIIIVLYINSRKYVEVLLVVIIDEVVVK